MNNWLELALKFLEKTGTTIKVEYLRNGPHFIGEKINRDIYKVTITRDSRSFSFEYGQSVVKSFKYKHKQTKKEFTTSGHSAGQHKWKYDPDKLPKSKKEADRFSEWEAIEGIPPNEYEILSCLTKYDPGSLEDFCSEFEYDTDSIKANKIYELVCLEFQNVQRIWSDAEIEELQEIN